MCMSQKLERDKGLINQKVELPENRNGVLLLVSYAPCIFQEL